MLERVVHGIRFLLCSKNKLPKTEIYSLTISEAESPKTRCQQSRASATASRGESFLASFSFCWLQTFLGLWLYHSNLCCCATFPSPLCLCVIFCCLTLIKTLVIRLKSYMAGLLKPRRGPNPLKPRRKQL